MEFLSNGNSSNFLLAVEVTHNKEFVRNQAYSLHKAYSVAIIAS